MDGWNAIMGNTVLKEAYPTQLAEYSKLYKFDEKPTFEWWVTFVPRNRDHLISSVKVGVKTQLQLMRLML